MRKLFAASIAKGKPYKYTIKPANGADDNAKKLTDGQVSPSPRNNTEWVQIVGNDLEITIDLGEVQPVTKVTANFEKHYEKCFSSFFGRNQPFA